MPDHQTAMLAYVKLAALSQAKKQRIPRDKFLLLAGSEACRAGWLDVAARCRELIADGNAPHLINRFPTFAEALRDPDFQVFLSSLEKFCTYERAEHILRELLVAPGLPEHFSDADCGQYAIELLNGEIRLA